jgi:hypothetical protein
VNPIIGMRPSGQAGADLDPALQRMWVDSETSSTSIQFKLIMSRADKSPGLSLKFGVCSPIPGETAIDCWNHRQALEVKAVIIGERLRALREGKRFSQGEVEERTGLLRAYVSRVENGHAVPAIETMEKFARALEAPMYQLL